MKDPLVDDVDATENGDEGEDGNAGDDAPADASKDDPSVERERAREVERYNAEKKLLRSAAKLEKEHDEILLSANGNTPPIIDRNAGTEKKNVNSFREFKTLKHQ